MLRGCPGLAAIALCLLPASPAAAREQDQGRGEHDLALGGAARAEAERERGFLPPAGRRGLQYSTNEFVRVDGSPGREARIVGSLPVDDSIDVGVGLYTVTGAEPKERALHRIDPLRDVAPRSSRVAAVGLRMRF